MIWLHLYSYNYLAAAGADRFQRRVCTYVPRPESVNPPFTPCPGDFGRAEMMVVLSSIATRIKLYALRLWLPRSPAVLTEPARNSFSGCATQLSS